MQSAKMKAFLAKFYRPAGLPRVPVPAPASGDSDAGACDMFARLPFELLVLVLAYLEPADISASVSASRVLRAVWLSDEVWPAVADRWFPGLAARIQATASKNNSESNGEVPAKSELFRRSLLRICRRTGGRFAAAMHYGFGLASDEFFQLSKTVPVVDGGVHSYESVDNLEVDDAQRFSRFMMYRNGRAAWWPEGFIMPYLAVVDDLRTRARRVYMFPNRGKPDQGYKTAMGDKLFIMGHETQLHVWHLELNRLESFNVPMNFKRCITEGETVLVVSQNSDVYLWQFGGKLQHIDMHRLACYPREYVVSGGPPVWTPRIWLSSQQGLHLRNSQLLIDFILSPTTHGVFFVITLALDGSGTLMVDEICNGKIAATYVMEDRIYSDPRTSERGLLKWEKLNSFGGYCLVQVIQEPLTTNDAEQSNGICPCGLQSRQLVSLCFNIYTKSFSVLHHHLGNFSPWMSHIWNDRLFIMDEQPDTLQAASNKRPVMCLAPCTEANMRRERTGPALMYTTTHENASLVCRRRRVPFEVRDMHKTLNIELVLDVLQEFSPDPRWKAPFIPRPPDNTFGRLVGDDEFFLSVNPPSYTVLSFGEGFPINIPSTDESRSWWRKPNGSR
ncbi:hypothetical protein F4777DRAFT_370553 [Nemania sp. FL0916]|nr:hypothetical protein F4777DRAFT_370553 [Nemania sp. FL0916]